MKLYSTQAEWFIPDGLALPQALTRTTHLCISAHQDDIEIMAYHGIVECFQKSDKWFTGVVVTNGAGSPRDDLYADYTNEQMAMVRRQEQKKAAYVGEYAAQALLDHTSSNIKNSDFVGAVEDIRLILEACNPQVVYTHNPADKHDTHIGVCLKTIQAIRAIPVDKRPERVYGCEVWRDLDWMIDSDKVGFDVSAHPNIAASLVGVFDSQICGGKRYDLATTGRRMAHATYFASHGTDLIDQLTFAMDLTPLTMSDEIDPAEYVKAYLDRFSDDVLTRLKKIGG